MKKTSKVLLILSFLMIGMVYYFNEPPLLSQSSKTIKKTKEKAKVKIYTLKDVDLSFKQDIVDFKEKQDNIINQNTKLARTNRYLRAENKALYSKVDTLLLSLQEAEECDCDDSTEASIQKRRNWIQKLLGIGKTVQTNKQIQK